MVIYEKKEWYLYTKPQFQGLQKLLGAGWYNSYTDMGFPNDKLASLKTVWWNELYHKTNKAQIFQHVAHSK